MLRSISTRLQAEVSTQFGYTEVDTETAGPRDVLWSPDDIAFRAREEQSSRLERDLAAMMPFLSFWRTGFALNKRRMNNPLATKGAYTTDAATAKYKVVPVDQVFQIEFWADDPLDFEAAIENWYRWAAPPSELVLTDESDVTFQFPLEFGEAQDNSRITEIREIGRVYRATFPLVVMGVVITSGGTFAAIETIKWNIWDYSAYGTPETAIKLKEVEITS